MSGMRISASSASGPSANSGRVTVAYNETTEQIEAVDASANRVPFDSDKLFADMTEVSAGTNRTLDTDDIGAVLVFTGSGSPTWTLPAANALGAGQLIGVVNWGSSPLTVQRAGSDTIDGGSSTSEGVDEGTQALFVSNGTDRWYRVTGGGSASAGYPVETTNNSTSYTLDANDANSTVRKVSGSDAVFTLPAASTYDDGTIIKISNTSSSRLAVAPPSGNSLGGWANDIRLVVKPNQELSIRVDGSNYHVDGGFWTAIDIPNAFIQANYSGMDDAASIYTPGISARRYYILAAIITNTTAETTVADLTAYVGIAASYNGIFSGRLLTTTGSQSAAVNFSTNNALGLRLTASSGDIANADIPWVQLEFIMIP
jgi:hypothetical protein